MLFRNASAAASAAAQLIQLDNTLNNSSNVSSTQNSPHSKSSINSSPATNSPPNSSPPSPHRTGISPPRQGSGSNTNNNNSPKLSSNTNAEVLLTIISYFHSMYVIVFGTILIFSELPSFHIWRHSRWLGSPTSHSQMCFFSISIIYFVLDTIAIAYTRTKQKRKARRWLIHHVLCIIGLLSPIVSGYDGALVLVGIVIGEISNPVLAMQQLVKYSKQSSNSHLQYYIPGFSLVQGNTFICMDLSLLHIILFISTRFICLQFTAHAVVPFAALLITKTIAMLLLLLNALFLLDYLPTITPSTTTNSIVKPVSKHRKHFNFTK